MLDAVHGSVSDHPRLLFKSRDETLLIRYDTIRYDTILYILTLQNSCPPQFKSFSTHFYTRIANTTDSTSHDDELTRAARQISGDTRRTNTNALLEHWLFFPQHMGIDHWALLAVHLPSRHIHLLDSLMCSDHAEYLNRFRTLKEVLKIAWDMSFETPPPVWKHTIRTDSPRQTNSVDCGVYMLAFCILLYTRIMNYASVQIWPVTGDPE